MLLRHLCGFAGEVCDSWFGVRSWVMVLEADSCIGLCANGTESSWDPLPLKINKEAMFFKKNIMLYPLWSSAIFLIKHLFIHSESVSLFSILSYNCSNLTLIRNWSVWKLALCSFEGLVTFCFTLLLGNSLLVSPLKSRCISFGHSSFVSWIQLFQFQPYNSSESSA